MRFEIPWCGECSHIISTQQFRVHPTSEVTLFNCKFLILESVMTKSDVYLEYNKSSWLTLPNNVNYFDLRIANTCRLEMLDQSTSSSNVLSLLCHHCHLCEKRYEDEKCDLDTFVDLNCHTYTSISSADHDVKTRQLSWQFSCQFSCGKYDESGLH